METTGNNNCKETKNVVTMDNIKEFNKSIEEIDKVIKILGQEEKTAYFSDSESFAIKPTKEEFNEAYKKLSMSRLKLIKDMVDRINNAE